MAFVSQNVDVFLLAVKRGNTKICDWSQIVGILQWEAMQHFIVGLFLRSLGFHDLMFSIV